MSQSLKVLLFVLTAAFGIGCGDSGTDRDAMTPAEFFNETQVGTSTPNGPVKSGSARDTENGRIRYDTEDGSTFEVTPQPNEEGGYRYSNPQKVRSSGG